MTSRNHAPLLLALGIGSAAGFAFLARSVARRKTAPVDHQVHQRVAVEPGHPVREAAEKASPIGKWWTYVPAAVLASAYVASSSTRRGALPILGAAAIAAAINEFVFDDLPQPPAPPGRPSPDHPVFPSGHAFGTSSVALTAAYVLLREELASAGVVIPLALTAPVTTSLARMMEEKHWLSDIAGGHIAALALASLLLAGYEVVRD